MIDAIVITDRLKTLVRAVSIVTDEPRIHIEPDSVSITATDPARVSMLSLTVPAYMFEHFYAEPDVVRIPLQKIKGFLAIADDPKIHITREDDGTLRLNSGGLTRRMPLLSAQGERSPRIPDLQYSASATMPVKALRTLVKASAAIGDAMRLTIDADRMRAECLLNCDSIALELSPPDIIIECDGTQSSLYPLDYLAVILKGLPSDADITLRMATDYPLNMELGSNVPYSLQFLLSPRIEGGGGAIDDRS